MKKLWDFLTTDKVEYSTFALDAILVGVACICVIVGRAYILTGGFP